MPSIGQPSHNGGRLWRRHNVLITPMALVAGGARLVAIPHDGKPTRMVWRQSLHQLPQATGQFLLGIHDKCTRFSAGHANIALLGVLPTRPKYSARGGCPGVTAT